MAYWEQGDLEDRLSEAIVRALLDDDNNGAPAPSVIARLQDDSDSHVNSYLRPIYRLPLSSVPNEVKRLSLDVACAMAAMRRPEVVRRDGKALMEMALADLKSLRRGDTRLDVEVLPPANTGGTVRSGDPVNPTPVPKAFGDGTGIF